MNIFRRMILAQVRRQDKLRNAWSSAPFRGITENQIEDIFGELVDPIYHSASNNGYIRQMVDSAEWKRLKSAAAFDTRYSG